MRGGYRAGAGRPKGTGGAAIKAARLPGVKVADGDMTPLEYALGVVNDPEADPERRDRMCIALLPYVHARRADRKPSKKEEAQARAEEVVRGSTWDGLLPDSGGGRYAPAIPPRFAPRPLPAAYRGEPEQ